MHLDTRAIPTYPFSEPNPLPILARDTRLYPYFSFEGYAHESTPQQWKVVTLENEWIEVKILPEVGGKVWGARVKKTGHDFIYTNDALKFRNVAAKDLIREWNDHCDQKDRNHQSSHAIFRAQDQPAQQDRGDQRADDGQESGDILARIYRATAFMFTPETETPE